MHKSKLFLSDSQYIAKQFLLLACIFCMLFLEFPVQNLKKVVIFCEVWVDKAEIFENLPFSQTCQYSVSEYNIFFRRKKL